MKKDSLICFRASRNLHESLAAVAREDRRSLSSTIEMVLTAWLKERKAFQGVAQEKRRHPRRSLAVPAVINLPEPGRMGIGAITEISLGGVKVVIPKDFKHQIRIDAEGSRFEIVFSLPAGSRPVSLTCESRRVVDAGESVQVGAFFVDSDFKSYRDLQAYLM